MAVRTGDKSEQITIRVSEKLKAQMLYQSLLEKKNLAEWIRETLEEAIKEKSELR